MHHWSPTERGIPRGDLMHTVTTSREGLLRFGFSELEKPKWQIKNVITLFAAQPIPRKLSSLRLPRNSTRQSILKSEQPLSGNRDMADADAQPTTCGHVMATVLTVPITPEEMRSLLMN